MVILLLLTLNSNAPTAMLEAAPVSSLHNLPYPKDGKIDNQRQPYLRVFYQIEMQLQKYFGTIVHLLLLTLNSNAPTAMPEAAPVPERPMKCSLPILLAKRDAPT